MAGPVLLVEVPMAETTRAETAALVQACTEGLGTGRCELSSSSQPADGVAIVSLRGKAALAALIEVGSPRSRARPWRSQEIEFRPQDERIERFRTLGLAIATLYNETRLDAPAEVNGEADNAAPGAARGEKPASDKPDANAAPSHHEATPPRGNESHRSSLGGPLGWLSAGAVAAYDSELSSPLRFGGQVALGVAPLELPLFSSLSGSYTVGRIPSGERSSEIWLSWAAIGIGAGGYWPLVDDVQLRVSIHGVIVRLDAHGSDPEFGRQESQRWLLGGQAGLELVAWASRRWGLTLGPQVQQLTGGTAIAVRGSPVAKVAALSFQFGASLELRPFQR
jgi:hypothetical protein